MNEIEFQEIVSRPNAWQALCDFFKEKAATKDSIKLGEEIAFLIAKEEKNIELLDFVRRGFDDEPDEKSFEIGAQMLEAGLLHIDDLGISGLEYLVRSNFEKLQEIYDESSMFYRDSINNLLCKPYPDGQNIFHKLVAKGDIVIVKKILSLVYEDFGELKFMVEEAIKDPTKNKLVHELMKKKDAIKDEEWRNDEDNLLLMAIKAKKTPLAMQMINDLHKTPVILIFTLKKVREFLTERAIIKNLINGLSRDEKAYLSSYFVSAGDSEVSGVMEVMLNIPDENPLPLHQAVLNGDIARINNLMAEERKSVHAESQFSQARDRSGRTALMLAADYDKFDIIKHLLEQGAAFKVDEQKYIFNKILRQLRELKMGFYKDGDATKEAKIEEKKELLRVLISNNQVDRIIEREGSGPALIKLVNLRRDDLAQVFLEIGVADVERDRDFRGDTILHRACILESHELIKYLTDSREMGGLAIDPEIENRKVIDGVVKIIKPIDRVKDDETKKLMTNIIKNKMGSSPATPEAASLSKGIEHY